MSQHFHRHPNLFVAAALTGGLLVGCNPPLMDARTFDDPCIVCLNHLLQVKVRQHPLRNVVARSEDACTDLRHD